MTLSVLIPTLTERRGQFTALKNNLTHLSRNHSVEILSLEDNREKTTGQKRNQLIDMANGKYSVFIDDDDNVPNYYFDSIFDAIRTTPDLDCIGFKGILIDNTKPQKDRQVVFRHSKGLQYSAGKVNGEYLRPPNHLNPMLTDYFKQIRFPDLTFGEDYDFCLKLDKAGLVQNEVFLGIIMYHYHFNPHKPVNKNPVAG